MPVTNDESPLGEANQRDFHHPYVPYQIQLDFMNAVYDVISQGKIGIFESPTGTGKSLSLICGAMTWLRDHQTLQHVTSEIDPSTSSNSNEPAWVVEHHRKLTEEANLRKYKEFENRLQRARQVEAKERAKVTRNYELTEGITTKRMKSHGSEQIDLKYLVDDYDSDSETTTTAKALPNSNVSPEVQALLDKLGGRANQNDDEDEDFHNESKIFYASRTHSQLTQFVQQLRLPEFPASEIYSSFPIVRHVPLSSRKQLCIHPTVSRLRDVNQINDKCAELQQNSIQKRCAFMKSDHVMEDRVENRNFRDKVLADIRDIEDLGQIGKIMSVCPYYGSRKSVDFSEIVTLPYPLLLQNRNVLNISIKNQIVIIDEAHNLLDTISSLFSMSISLNDIIRSKSGVVRYLEKFSKKLNAGNKVYITQIIKLLDVLEQYLVKYRGSNGNEVYYNEVLQNQAVDTINIHKIQKYLEKSKLARKIESYVSEVVNPELEQKQGQKRVITSVPVLSKIASFMSCLNNPSSEGKVYFEQINDDRFLKYLLLDPSFHFKSIVDEAKCVILAGGTMEPVDDFIRYLFPYVPRDRIQTLSCDHVIPKNNLGAWTVSSGPTGQPLRFTFEKQNLDTMSQELGRTISNFTVVIPDGIVVFFPSYKYMEQVVLKWKIKPPHATMTIWDQLNNRKKIFQEPREANKVDEILSLYAQAISDPDHNVKGAMLLAVVGGKMSEGINFSDQLARGIIMVGLPYPNARSADLIAKRNYIEKKVFEQFKLEELGKLNTDSPSAGDMSRINTASKRASEEASKEYYENICMRAVNQSIGRGIRHANDYAVILFVDDRFNRPNIQQKLPQWIRHRMDPGTKDVKIGSVLKSVREFFKHKSAAS
ncbi:helicase C-terminal domain-containing protein [Lipomyces japonicus]|uniref:helicase C-terminal domain-containing protein n=1 Tax=Lipomyces japonicus TaxID=56871 RepID=UPI0034CF7612